MNERLIALQKRAEQYRRAMQDAHERRLKEAAADLATWLDAKSAEVTSLASALKDADVQPRSN